MDVKDKGVFITGAAVGIGRAVVELLLEKGAKVLFCDINEPKGKETLEELRKRHPTSDVTFVPCDVADSQQLKATFEEAVSRFGAVDVCINNAGIMNEGNWEKCIAINQVAVMRGSLMALEHMRRDKGGRGGIIINTASANSFFHGVWEFPAYAATKHAVAAFTTGWSNSPDNEAHGVRWGAVCPYACCTCLSDLENENQMYDSIEVRKAEDKTNWMKPRDVAYAFLTLLEDGESNGGLMKVYKQGGQLYQELLMMDKSNDPITSLQRKYCKQQAAEH